jgi:hypothetical protein
LHRRAITPPKVAQYLYVIGAQVDVFCAAFLDALDEPQEIAAGRATPVALRDFIASAAAPYGGRRRSQPRRCLENGAVVGESGGRLLTSAASRLDDELMRLLLDHGAEAVKAGCLGPLATDRTSGGSWRRFDLNVPIRDQRRR